MAAYLFNRRGLSAAATAAARHARAAQCSLLSCYIQGFCSETLGVSATLDPSPVARAKAAPLLAATVPHTRVSTPVLLQQCAVYTPPPQVLSPGRPHKKVPALTTAWNAIAQAHQLHVAATQSPSACTS